jgi:large subunit ribosomal protein L25
MSNASLSFTAALREATGGSATRELRSAGKVPVTLSRPGKPSIHLAFDNHTAEQLAHQVVHLTKLTFAGETVTALKGAISRHCLKDNIEHIDLIQVDEQSEIKVDVNVSPDARNCPGVKAGGIVEQRLRKVKIKCKANAIPDSIGVDLGDVQIMQTVYANKLVLPKGATLVTNSKLPVLSIVITRGMAKSDAPAADADPKAAAAKPAAGAPAAAAGAKPAAGAPAKKDDKKK